MSKKWKNKLMDNYNVKYTDLGSELEATKDSEVVEYTSPVPEEPQLDKLEDIKKELFGDSGLTQEILDEETKDFKNPFDELNDTVAKPVQEVVEPIQEDNNEVVEKKAELLTNEEKELLQRINAFSGYRLLWVLKTNADILGMEQVRLRLSSTDKTKQYSVSLPMFKLGEKFKNLETGKMYMLSELGV